MTEAHADVTEHGAHDGADAHAGHPSDRQYVVIALILAAVTAVEVGLYYTNLGVHIYSGMLGVLAVTKFGMVVAYFMHLKFDNRILRRLFITGFVLASFCYLAYLWTLGVFQLNFLPWA